MSFGEDFGFGFRHGALRGAAEQAEATSGDHHHFPYARRVRLHWTKLPDGTWDFDGEDEHLWEVFCAECGDTDGPADLQPEVVQRLRGPYKGEHKARKMATHHFNEN